MESLLTIQKPGVKRLNELLQEQQEPFSMDVYLMERGYLKKILNSKSMRYLKRSKGSTSVPCHQILKTVLNKLVSSKSRRGTHVPGLERSSPASSVTVYESCSDDTSSGSDASRDSQLCSFRDEMAAADKTQDSPVSVLLDELPCDQVSPLHNHIKCCSRSNKKETRRRQPRRITEDAIFSASLWDLLQHSELRQLLDTSSDGVSLTRKTKRVLEQKKQLLFDCLREVLESRANNHHITSCLGGEEMGKIVCDQILLWTKQNANVTSVSYLINSDFWEGTQDWEAFKPQTKKIGIEISDFILEDMEMEIVLEIIQCS